MTGDRGRSGPITASARTTVGTLVACCAAVATVILGVYGIVDSAVSRAKDDLRREMAALEKRIELLERK